MTWVFNVVLDGDEFTGTDKPLLAIFYLSLFVSLSISSFRLCASNKSSETRKQTPDILLVYAF